MSKMRQSRVRTPKLYSQVKRKDSKFENEAGPTQDARSALRFGFILEFSPIYD